MKKTATKDLYSTPQRRADQLWGRCTNVDDPDACWEWTGAKSGRGKYGKISVDGVLVDTHVQAWVLVHGPVPPGLEVRHLVCHNTLCCNPRHLDVGTHAENQADMSRDGTAARGERSANARLSSAEVLAIRSRHAAGDGLGLLSVEYGVARQHVWQIVTRKRWVHLEEAS